MAFISVIYLWNACINKRWGNGRVMTRLIWFGTLFIWFTILPGARKTMSGVWHLYLFNIFHLFKILNHRNCNVKHHSSRKYLIWCLTKFSIIIHWSGADLEWIEPMNGGPPCVSELTHQTGRQNIFYITSIPRYRPRSWTRFGNVIIVHILSVALDFFVLASTSR